SGGFWAFVGVVAGIYTIFALGLQLQFGFAGLLNFGQVAFMAIGAYTMAILVVKEGWSTWLAAPLGVAVAAAAGLLLGLPALRLRSDYFAIVTIAFSEIVRYVATNQDSLTGGSQGTIALGKVGTAAQYNGQWERFQARVQSWLGVSSKDVTMIVILGGLGRVWAVPVGAAVFGFLFAGTRFLDFPPLSYLSGADRAYVRLIVIGLAIIALVVLRPQGILGKRQEMVFE